MYKQICIVEEIKPDPTKYNQNRQVFKPVNAVVAVKLEVTSENFDLDGEFKEKILQAEIGSGEWPEQKDVPEQLIYTITGWNKIKLQLEEPYEEVEETEPQEWDAKDFPETEWK